jgi:hypothetical protein
MPVLNPCFPSLLFPTQKYFTNQYKYLNLNGVWYSSGYPVHNELIKMLLGKHFIFLTKKRKRVL